MTSESLVVLERLLQQAGLTWIMKSYVPREGALPFLRDRLASAGAEYIQRFDVKSPFTPEALADAAENNLLKVRAFLQATAVTSSGAMLVMAWRILEGLRISHVEMHYADQDSFSLVVQLARWESGKPHLESYQSDDINDAALLRHLGITKVNGRPLFDGFYALRT